MKKAFLFMIIFAMCLSLAVPFTTLAAKTTSSTTTSECDHKWVDDKDGTLGKHCKLCEADYCDVNEHTVGTAATCTKKAVCKVCGDEYGKIKSHKYTETNDCSAKVTCDNCGTLIKSAGNHDWEAASCTKVKTCKSCGTTEGSVLFHLWGEGTVTKTPTLTTNGSIRFVCESCGLIKNQTIYFTSDSEASPIDSLLPIIIISIVALIVVIVIIILVIAKRKKK